MSAFFDFPNYFKLTYMKNYKIICIKILNMYIYIRGSWHEGYILVYRVCCDIYVLFV